MKLRTRNQLLSGVICATAVIFTSLPAQGDLNFIIKDMTYGRTSGSVSVTATSVTLGLYATFSGVTYGGLNLTRGYFGATSSVDASGSLSNAAVGALFAVGSPATAQVGISANLNGDGVTDWGDQPANTSSTNFFFVDAAAHPKPANASGTGVNSSGTAIVSVLVGTIRLNMTSIAPNGSVNVGYGLSNAMSASDPLFAKTIWAENYSISTSGGSITGVSNVKNEISNPSLIHFSPFTLTFAVPTWSATAAGSNWGINGNVGAGASWSTNQMPDGAGFPVVFGNTVASGSGTVSSPHTVGAITFTGGTSHNLVTTSFTGTIGTATAIVTTSGAITLSRGALANAIITSNSSVDQNLLVPLLLVSSGTIVGTTGAGKLNLGPVAMGAGNTLTIPAASKVSMTSLNGPAINGLAGRGNLDDEGKLQLINDLDGLGHTNLTDRNTVAVVTVLDFLNIGNAGLFDLGNHDMIVRNGGEAGVDQIEAWILDGYHGGDWMGPDGITTSGPELDRGLGIVRMADLIPYGFNGFFDGVAVNADDVLVKYFWKSDTNPDNNPQGYTTFYTAPEPASFGLFALAAGGVLWRRPRRPKG